MIASTAPWGSSVPLAKRASMSPRGDLSTSVPRPAYLVFDSRWGSTQASVMILRVILRGNQHVQNNNTRNERLCCCCVVLFECLERVRSIARTEKLTSLNSSRDRPLRTFPVWQDAMPCLHRNWKCPAPPQHLCRSQLQDRH